MEKNKKVYGLDLQPHTECRHYFSSLDIIAIKFKCCLRYYACYFCHQAMTYHSIERWGPDELHIKAILCGICGTELTIEQYLLCNHHCPHCKSPFNPGCRTHWDLYFFANKSL